MQSVNHQPFIFTNHYKKKRDNKEIQKAILGDNKKRVIVCIYWQCEWFFRFQQLEIVMYCILADFYYN